MAGRIGRRPSWKAIGWRAAIAGLVHVVDFQALKITRHNPDGTWQADHLDTGKYRVHFRVRRNNRATGQIRRHMRKDAP